jgi:hypothetical protein
MAAPSTRHQDIVLRLGYAFLDHVRRLATDLIPGLTIDVGELLLF